MRERKWDHEVKVRLENSGWLVFKCAASSWTGSKFLDWIAFHPGKLPLWVDCRFPRRPPPDETLMPRNLAKANGARYIIPVKKNKAKEEGGKT